MQVSLMDVVCVCDSFVLESLFFLIIDEKILLIFASAIKIILLAKLRSEKRIQGFKTKTD